MRSRTSEYPWTDLRALNEWALLLMDSVFDFTTFQILLVTVIPLRDFLTFWADVISCPLADYSSGWIFVHVKHFVLHFYVWKVLYKFDLIWFDLLKQLLYDQHECGKQSSYRYLGWQWIQFELDCKNQFIIKYTLERSWLWTIHTTRHTEPFTDVHLLMRRHTAFVSFFFHHWNLKLWNKLVIE